MYKITSHNIFLIFYSKKCIFSYFFVISFILNITFNLIILCTNEKFIFKVKLIVFYLSQRALGTSNVIEPSCAENNTESPVKKIKLSEGPQQVSTFVSINKLFIYNTLNIFNYNILVKMFLLKLNLRILYFLIICIIRK